MLHGTSNIRVRGIIAAGLAVAWIATGAAPAESATVFKGRFGCAKDNRAIAGARVELTTFKWGAMGKFPTNLQVIGTTQTDERGRWGFSVSGEETEIFARIVLNGRETEVREGLAPWNHWADTTDHQNDVPEHDYGLQLMRGYECAVYNGFRDAALEYEQATGSRAPQGEVVVRAGAPTSGVPFAFYDVVWWPSSYSVMRGAISVAQHEFAHTFRHLFDGGEVHFFGDLAVFNYLRHHSAESCSETNAGFAFNEGWAEYWAGDVRPPCTDARNPNIERNVAAELKAMEIRCRMSRGAMVDVLRASRGRIHSVVDFGGAANCSSDWGRLDKSPDTSAERRLGAIRRAEASKKWQRAKDAQIRRLRTALRDSRRAAGRVGEGTTPCVVRTCARLAERRMRPVFDAGKLEQARVERKAFGFLANRREQLRLSPAAAVRKLKARRASAERQMAKIAGSTLRRAARALHGLGSDDEVVALRAALRAAAAAATRGDTTALLQSLAISTGRGTARRGGTTEGDVALVDVTAGK